MAEWFLWLWPFKIQPFASNPKPLNDAENHKSKLSKGQIHKAKLFDWPKNSWGLKIVAGWTEQGRRGHISLFRQWLSYLSARKGIFWVFNENSAFILFLNAVLFQFFGLLWLRPFVPSPASTAYTSLYRGLKYLLKILYFILSWLDFWFSRLFVGLVGNTALLLEKKSQNGICVW